MSRQRAISATLAAYLARQFLASLLTVLLFAALIILLFDGLELLRRAAGQPEATMTTIAGMALLRLPTLLLTVLPLCILFGAMIAFWRLTRSRELVVARASGLSAWQFLAPALALAFLVGAAKVAALEPLASAMHAAFDRVERRLDGAGTPLLGGSGLWFGDRLEQREAGDLNPGQVLVHAHGIQPAEMAVTEVTLFRFGTDGRFAERIDAPLARLSGGAWEIEDATVTAADGRSARRAYITLPSTLAWHDLIGGAAPPEALSVWQLPAFIGVMEQAGFSALAHKLRLQNLIASPFLLCGLVLVAAAFALHPGRRVYPARIAAMGVATGLGLFLASDLVLALGAAGQVPVPLAAWAPALICLLAGTAALLHFEDG